MPNNPAKIGAYRCGRGEKLLVIAGPCVIESEAYKKVQQMRGEADAKVTQIYAAAYSQSAEARSLYTFVKTLDTYKKVISENDTLVLSSKSDLYRFLNDSSGGEK